MARWVRLCLIGLAIGGTVLLWVIPIGWAFAQSPPPACPEGALDETGFVQPELETRRLRTDLGAMCSVLEDRAGTAHADSVAVLDRLGLLRDDLAGLTTAVDALGGDLQGLRDRLDGELQVVNGSSSLAVEDGTGAETATTGFEALHADLWFLIGLGASLIAAYALYRQVMP